MTVSDTDRGWQAIKRELLKADDATVTVGIHADARTSDEGLSTAQVGAFHEYGLGVLMRAWLAPSIDDATPELLAMAESLYFGPMLEGKANAKQALGRIGERMQAVAQHRLRDKDPSWPALADATKQRKANKVRGSKREGKNRRERRAEFLAGDGNPLIDTGLLLQSVRYKVHFDRVSFGVDVGVA